MKVQDSLLSRVLKVSREVPKRKRYKVLGHLMEETGELALEVNIAEGESYKTKGEDGVFGESIDTLLCAIDMIYVDNPNITEGEIIEMVERKLKKWSENIKQQIERENKLKENSLYLDVVREGIVECLGCGEMVEAEEIEDFGGVCEECYEGEI